MSKIQWHYIYRTILPILLGTAIYAFGLQYFVLPNQLMEGGVTGIGVLLNYALGWKLSITTLALNIPLFILGMRVLGKMSMVMTVVGTVSLSAFLAIFERAISAGWIMPFYAENDSILAALYAGVTLGSGLGIVFRFGGTTGGVDIAARILTRSRGWSMGQIILASDAIIIALSLIYIPKEKVLYTLVTVFIASKLIDFIQEGAYAAKAFTIISEHGEAIAARITRGDGARGDAHSRHRRLLQNRQACGLLRRWTPRNSDAAWNCAEHRSPRVHRHQ